MDTRTLRRGLAAAFALGLLATACSSDREDADVAAAADDTTASAPDSTFGDLDSPCGEGDAAGATDQGVTDDAIKIGYGDDAGFPGSPGLNHEMGDAVEAMIEWCNEQGGINGRPIEGTYYDAKITEVNNVVMKACDAEFMLVGQGFSLDSAQEETRRGCGLPSVPGFAVSPAHANGPMKFESVPVPGDYWRTYTAAHLKDLFPEKITKAAALFGNYAATIDAKERVKAAYSAMGYEFTCEQPYNISGEADYRPILQRLKDCGAELVYWGGSPVPQFQNALAAADQIGFRPVWIADGNAYNPKFAAVNTDGFADDVYFGLQFTPFEEAEENPATQQYVEIVEAAGGDIAMLGQQAAASFLLWATAADACGSDLTRECVLEELSDTHDWTAGGLHVASDPGAAIPGACGATFKLNGTGYERVAPEEPGTFDCDPTYAYRITDPALLERSKIGPDRIAGL